MGQSTSILIDEGRNVSGSKITLVGKICKQVSKNAAEPLVIFHYIVHQQVLWSLVLVLQKVIEIVFTTNYVRCHALNHRHFQNLLKGISEVYAFEVKLK